MEDSKFPSVVKGQIGGGSIQTVNARDLHDFLESGQDFSTWIKNRISQYGFVDGQDFVIEAAPQNYGAGNRGSRIEYHLSLDMAKELSMVERNEKGKVARQYFIECERRAKEPLAIPTTAEAFASAFQMIAQAERTQAEHAKAIASVEKRIEEVEMAQTVLTRKPAGSESITHIRRRIGHLYGLSANVIDEVMRQMPYSPRPAAMVKNDHVDAEGTSYAVFWQKDVSKTFERFVSECEQVTPFMYTHPFIEGRFRFVGRRLAARAA
ncbi:antirepressor [Brucella anthropi]|uniref:antA/AntB antirepressor family protein n=1 Tax=Brucella anthropi TaxID=529 RepID=UPI00044A2BB9|nr:antA/AntB antirepressor family protein [Brucella anthropi]EXL06211.1 antirepressor [Brucella anthropi]